MVRKPTRESAPIFAGTFLVIAQMGVSIMLASVDLGFAPIGNGDSCASNGIGSGVRIVAGILFVLQLGCLLVALQWGRTLAKLKCEV